MNINLLNSESCCQNLSEVIPDLCMLAIILTAFLIGLNITLKHWFQPWYRYRQERKMKEEAHEREKYWHNQKKN